MSWILILLLSNQILAAETNPVFRFHLTEEPHTLDPSKISGTDSSFFFSNLYRGLYRYSDTKGLVPEVAKSCKRSKLKLTCTLRGNFNWSDGSPVTASDFVFAFQRFFNSDNKARDLDLLLNLKNGQKILDGKSDPSTLGLEAPKPKELVFHFDREDPEFEYKLSSPSLVPIKKLGTLEQPEQNLYNGPYILKERKKGSKARLEPNAGYPLGNPRRPSIEILFISEDITSINLFDAEQLNFLRRVPTTYLKKFRNQAGLTAKPLSRFDYIGFGPTLKDFPQLREAMALGLDYEEFKVVFDALGRPGCPSLPMSYLEKDHCYRFQPDKARRLIEQQKKLGPLPKLSFGFSQAGGDDIRKAAEWFQGQWKKHLGLQIELNSEEQKVFTQTLKTNPPPVFRRGVPLDRPTCLAALENFLPNNPDNFIRFLSPRFEENLQTLARANQSSARKKLCSQAIEELLKDHVLIPLGRMHFFLFSDQKFEGIEVNEMNQINLSDLRPASVSK